MVELCILLITQVSQQATNTMHLHPRRKIVSNYSFELTKDYSEIDKVIILDNNGRSTTLSTIFSESEVNHHLSGAY